MIAQLLEDLRRIETAEGVVQAALSQSIGAEVTGILITSVPVLADRLLENVIVSTWPKSWIDHYTDREYLKSDPIARNLFCTRKPYIWSEYCASRDLNAVESKIMVEAGEVGLVDGVTIPVHDFGGTTCISFSTDGRPLSSASCEVLRVIGVMILDRIEDIVNANAAVTKHNAYSLLARREIECLHYAWMGYNSKAIARLLNISFRTVDRYILTASRKLMARNRTDAVRIALELGVFKEL